MTDLFDLLFGVKYKNKAIHHNLLELYLHEIRETSERKFIHYFKVYEIMKYTLQKQYDQVEEVARGPIPESGALHNTTVFNVVLFIHSSSCFQRAAKEAGIPPERVQKQSSKEQ